MTNGTKVDVGTINVVATCDASPSHSNATVTSVEKPKKISTVNFKGWQQQMLSLADYACNANIHK